MRKVVGSVGAVLLFASPAVAADLAVKAPVMPGPIFGWTGFYIGGNVGWGWSDQAVNFSGSPSTVAAIARGQIPASLAQNPNGPLGGVQVGYNWQTGAFVLGIEADIDAADITKNSTLSAAIGGGSFPVTATASQLLNYLGTARGRLGYTITPTLLAYGTGGFAYGGAEVSSSVNTTPNCPGFCGGLTNSSTLTGWAAGGGLEYMISPNWTAKVEYLHYDLGNISQTYGDSFGRFPGTLVSTSTAFKGEIVRIGANYKF
jgi:outer membrane immunogenic protein